MLVTVDYNNYIKEFILEEIPGYERNPEFIEVPNPENLPFFIDNCESYKIEDGVAIFDEVKEQELLLEYKRNDLRVLREQECFPIINRGKLWYDGLSNTQLEDLDLWYKKWLDVTVTLIIPERPKWIK